MLPATWIVGHLLWECPFARNVWLCVRGRFKNVSMLSKISSLYLGWWWTDFLSLMWNVGRWCLGQFGMLGISFILRNFKPTPDPFLNGALGFLDEYQSSEACGCTPKLLILFVTFVCSGFTCAMFPPFCFFAVSSYCYSHFLSPIWLCAQRFYFVYFQLSI